MRKLTWNDYCDEYEKNHKYLRNLIIKLYKTPGNSVPDNTVHMIEKNLEENNILTIGDVNITVKSEEIELIYLCCDKKEIKELKKHYNIKSINNLELIISCVICTYEVSFNNILADVLTSNEAAELFGVTEGTLRSAMKTGKLKFGSDYRKSGRITLISKKAMEREYIK